MSEGTKRRDFLKYTAATGMGFWIAGTKTWAQEAESKSPNEKVNFASVGITGKGESDSSQASEVGNLVAICDTNEKVLEKRGSQVFPKARRFTDFRKMFDEMGKEIDAITVSIPDHNHAVVAMMGIKNKKAVYCQKPMTHYVAEARALRNAANEYKVATQMGNQGSAESGLRAGVEAIQAGAIGNVHSVHVWTNRPIWPQAPKRTDRPMGEDEPQGLNWDAWLGPAPYRPYVARFPGSPDPRCYEPFVWRGWWDFGTGALGDMGCHTANLPFRALKLDQVYPTHVQAKSGIVNFETYPSWASVTFDFPARGDMPPVKVHWYEGQIEMDDGTHLHNWPPGELFNGRPVATSGSLMVGDKGVMYSPDDYGAEWHLLPENKFRSWKAPEPTIPRMQGQDTDLWMKKELVTAIKGGPPAYSNFNIAGKLTEFILLGNAAIRAGVQHPLEYDGEAMKFTNWPEANSFLSREYRKGYSL